MPTPNIIIVIPAYNAHDTVGKVVERVKKEGFDNVVVVDDGSMSGKTSQVAKDAGALVLRHVINRGYGAALRTGMLWAKQNGADYVVTLDADGQHHPEEIKDLLKPVMENRADISLGSRFLNKHSNVPFFRKLFLKGGIKVIYFFYGLHLTDTHNGFRAMNRHALEKMQFSLDNMAHSSEYPAEIRKKRLRFVEVPVTVTYSEQTLARGQRTRNAFRILANMIWQKMVK